MIEEKDFVKVYGYTSQGKYLNGKEIFLVRGISSGKNWDKDRASVYCVSCKDPDKGFHVNITQCRLVGKGYKS